MSEKEIQEKTIQEKAIGVLTDAENIVHHSAALSYSKDVEEIQFHLYWINWYFKRLNSSVDSVNDVGF